MIYLIKAIELTIGSVDSKKHLYESQVDTPKATSIPLNFVKYHLIKKK